MALSGLWPLERNRVRLFANYLYFVVHVVFAMSDLYDVFGDLSLMIANLVETSIQVMLSAKMTVLGYSEALKGVLQLVKSGVHEKNFKNQEEIELYLEYNTIGKIFFKVANYLAMSLCLIYHFKPLENIMRAGKEKIGCTSRLRRN